MPAGAAAVSKRAWQGAVLALAACLGAAAVLLAAQVIVQGPTRWSFAGLRVTAQEPSRALAAAIIVALALLAGSWRTRRRGWYFPGLMLLVVAATIALLARGSETGWPTGDGALVELYTLSAAQGQQLLGAYSQFGWHHPGPLPFYWLAPFYVLSGYTTFGLGVGVFAANVVSLAVVAWIISRAREPGVGLALFALLAVYTVRLPGLMTSAWNPHLPIVPLLALVFVAAAGVAGDARMFLPALIVGSFIVQAHLALSLVVGALCAATLARIAFDAWRFPETRSAAAWRLVRAVFLAQVLWFLPLAEQVTSRPGNLTLLWQYFTNGNPGQTFALSWRAWSEMLGGLWRADFALAAGLPFQTAPTRWPMVLGALAVAGLVPLLVTSWRQQRPFLCALAATCLVASAAGFGSVVRVTALLGDYHIFWLSMIGIANLAAVLGGLAPFLRVPSGRWNVTLATGTAVIGPLAVVIINGVPLVHAGSRDRGARPALAVLCEQAFARLPAMGSSHPVLRLGENLWGDGAGLVLQARRRGMKMSVAPEMTWMFGENLAMDGREDLLLVLGRADEHERRLSRPGYVTLAEAGGIYIDAVSLIERPDERP